MTVSRLRGRSRGATAFGRARPSRATLGVLIALRVYAIAAIAIVFYTFMRSVRTH